jgi:hypothetical protein
MNQPADDGQAAARHWRSGLVDGTGALQQNLGVLVALVGVLPLYGELLMYTAVLPLGCMARLLACIGTWRTQGLRWFVSAALLGLGAGALAYLAGDAILQLFPPLIHDDPLDMPAFDALSPQMKLLGWIILALAVLEGLLCIGYAFAHRRHDPRHRDRLYFSGIVDICVAAMLFCLSGRANSSDEPPLAYLLAVVSALMLGISLFYGGQAFVMMAREARAGRSAGERGRGSPV